MGRSQPVQVEFDFGPQAEPSGSVRAGIALCLSGGGWRAALFHLGALTRLHEVGVLEQVGTISSVSGGSILAGFLASRFPESWPGAAAWREQVIQPFATIAARDLRNAAFRARAIPFGPAATTVFRRAIAERLGLGEAPLASLPEQPAYIFGAADIVSGKYWMFSREGVGAVDTRGSGRTAVEVVGAPEITVAEAVTASSCFPPIFPPMRFRPNIGTSHGDGLLQDGGLIDNTGVEAVIVQAKTILVSDGGGAFDAKWSGNPVKRLLRFASVADNRGRILSRRWITERFKRGAPEGCAWSIREDEWQEAQVPEALLQITVPRYPADVATRIGAIRTDLDSFSPAEIGILVNHGYLVTARALRDRGPFEDPPVVPVTLPFPEWGPAMDGTALMNALARSHRRSILGRGNPRIPIIDDLVFGKGEAKAP